MQPTAAIANPPNLPPIIITTTVQSATEHQPLRTSHPTRKSQKITMQQAETQNPKRTSRTQSWMDRPSWRAGSLNAPGSSMARQ